MIGKRALLSLAALLAAAPLIMSGIAQAQSATPTPKPADPNVLSSNYYSGAGGTLDGTVRTVNSSGAYMCDNFYVSDNDQELRECCACLTTPNGERILSVNNDLTSNPANGVATTDGSVTLLSSLATKTSSGYICAAPSKAVPAPQIAAWETHPDVSGLLTEEEFTPALGTAAEIKDIEAECAAIELVGSGKGVCTCGTGD